MVLPHSPALYHKLRTMRAPALAHFEVCLNWFSHFLYLIFGIIFAKTFTPQLLGLIWGVGIVAGIHIYDKAGLLSL